MRPLVADHSLTELEPVRGRSCKHLVIGHLHMLARGCDVITCSIDGCTKPAHARGWCGMHLRRWQRNGTTDAPLRTLRPDEPIPSDAARLDALIAIDEHGCWLWTGHQFHTAYGAFKCGRKTWLAHRASWTVHRGPIPEGMHLDHLCRVRACVNPDHLQVVTPSENMRRAVPHRRAPMPRVRVERTHCRNGHELTEAATYVDAKGHRLCRPCRTAAATRYRQKAA